MGVMDFTSTFKICRLHFGTVLTVYHCCLEFYYPDILEFQENINNKKIELSCENLLDGWINKQRNATKYVEICLVKTMESK